MRVRKTNIKPKSVDPSRAFRRVVTIVLSALAAIVILPMPAWWFSTNFVPPNLQVKNRGLTLKESQDIVGSLQLPGELAYSSVEDLGCDPQSSKLFESHMACQAIGQRYYKSSNLLDDDLKAASKALRNLGFAGPDLSQPGQMESSKDVSGLYHYTVKRDDRKYIALLGYYLDIYTGTDPSISSLIISGKVPEPKTSEHLYGITMRSDYMTCSYNLFVRPCPTTYQGTE